jgi:hypothetical protein
MAVHDVHPHRGTAPIGPCYRAGVACLLLAAACAANADLALDPTAACRLLDDHGIRARDGYRDLGQRVFRCASIGQRLPRGSPAPDEVHFAATGDRGRVRQLQLELALHSRGDLRAVLEAFAVLADAMVARSLDQPLPAEARRALHLGIPGAWRVGGADLSLERIGGAVPSLRFVIR